jgi:hypothetical protein
MPRLNATSKKARLSRGEAGLMKAIAHTESFTTAPMMRHALPHVRTY